MSEAPERQRAVRSDAGQPRLTARDIALLEFLLDMKAAYEGDLAVLAGRVTGTRPSAAAMQSMFRRWRTAGVADVRRLLAARPRVARLTSNGGRMFGEENFRPVSEFTSYHQAETAHVRLYVENPDWSHSQFGPVPPGGWVSERQFRQHVGEVFSGRGREIHVPDGVIEFPDDVRVAVEVERTAKSPQRMRHILDRLSSGAYKQVLYVVGSPEVEGVVRRAWNDLQDAAKKAGHRGPVPLGFLRVPQQIDK